MQSEWRPRLYNQLNTELNLPNTCSESRKRWNRYQTLLTDRLNDGQVQPAVLAVATPTVQDLWPRKLEVSGKCLAKVEEVHRVAQRKGCHNT
jgi:hypothetical protein